MMRMEYSPKADALYIAFDDETPVAYTEDVSRGPECERGIDRAADERPLGVEFLHASRGVDLTDIPRADEIAALLAARGFKVLV